MADNPSNKDKIQQVLIKQENEELKKKNQELKKEICELRQDNRKLAHEIDDRMDQMRKSGL